MDNLYLDINWISDNGPDLMVDINQLIKDNVKPDEKNIHSGSADIINIIKGHFNEMDLRRLFCISYACRTMLNSAYTTVYANVNGRRIFLDYDLINKMYIRYREDRENYLNHYKYNICLYDFQIIDTFINHEMFGLHRDITEVYNRFMEPILKTVETPKKGL